MGAVDERAINSGTNIRVSVGALASMVFGFGLFFYSEVQGIKENIEGKRAYFEARIDLKADKRQATDRYTGTQARQFKESVKQRFSDLEKLNKAQHDNFRWQLEHQATDLRGHGHNHSEIIHDKGH